MPPPQQIYKDVSVTGDVALSLGVETVIATLLNVTLPDPTMIVSLLGRFNLTTGVGATSITARLRRTSLVGTLVGEANPVTSPASQTEVFTIGFDDQPGDIASGAYVLTVAAAGAAATVVDAFLQAVIHTG